MNPTPTPSLADVYARRHNNFDALRVGLATTVIWSHCYALAGRPMDPVFALTRQVDAGSLAVDGFFILSGFLITQSWDGDPDLRDFSVKRALRLVPALIAALIFGAFVIGPLATPVSVLDYLTAGSTWAHFGSVLLHRHLASPLLFADNPVPHQLNASLWSLRYEIACYALVAAVGVTWRGRWRTAGALLFLAGLAGQAALSGTGPSVGPLATACRLVACFFAGATLYAARDRVPFHPGLAALAAGMLAVTGLLGGFHLAFPIAGAYLLLFLACWPALPLQGFGRHGDVSYGLYVFAYPIQQTIVQAAGPGISIPVFFLLAFLPTLGLAALSWRFIEAPALARKPRRRRTVPVPGACPTGAVWAVTPTEGS